MLCCLTLVPALQPIGASSRCVIGNLYTQQAYPECPDGKARLNQPGRAVYHDVSIHGFVLREAVDSGSSTGFSGPYPSGFAAAHILLCAHQSVA